MNIRFNNILNLRYLLILSLFLYPQISNADLLSEMNHWVKEEYGKARDEVNKLERLILHEEEEIARAAQYVAEKEAQAFNELATVMIKDVESAINWLENLDLTKLNGHCEATAEDVLTLTGPLSDALSGIEGDLLDHLPKIENDTLDEVEKLNFLLLDETPRYGICRARTYEGMACGVFPYVEHIINAVLIGEADSERMSRAVGNAYMSETCSRYSEPSNTASVAERGLCALMVPVIKEAQKGYSCVSRVVEGMVEENVLASLQVEDITGNADQSVDCTSAIDDVEKTKSCISHAVDKGLEKFLPSSAPGFDDDAQREICVKIGNVAFGMAVDTLVAGAIPDEAEQAQKIFKIAKLIRTGLNFQPMAEDAIEDLCHEGVQTDMHSGKIPTQNISTLSESNATHGLKLISQLDSPVCLDFIRDPQKVGGWHCHGRSNQRWNFHHLSGTDGHYMIESQYKDNYCLKMSDSDLSYGLGICDDKAASKIFKITAHGELESLKTGACLRNIGHIEHAIGGRCVSPTTSKGQAFEINQTLGSFSSLHNSALQGAEPEHKIEITENGQTSMYITNPNFSALRGTPGENRQISSGSGTPVCLNTTDDSLHDVNVFPCNHDNFQSWSFYSYNDNADYSDYFQIVNDHTGHCITTRGHNQTAKTEDCEKLDGSHRQMYFINDGRLQNLHSGLCLHARGLSKEGKVDERTCSDDINQKWNLFAK